MDRKKTPANSESLVVSSNYKVVDPGLLEVFGVLLELVAFGEHAFRLGPLQRSRIERRHVKVEKLNAQLALRLNDARAGVRLLRSTLSTADANLNLESIGFLIPLNELEIFRRGLEQLQVSIQSMTKLTYDLEVTLAGVPEAALLYFKMSQSGRRCLALIRNALNGELREPFTTLLEEVDAHLARSAEALVSH